MTVLAPSVDYNNKAVKKEMLKQANTFIAEFTGRSNFVLVGKDTKQEWPLEHCYIIWDLDKKILDPIYGDIESSIDTLCPALQIVDCNATIEQTKDALNSAISEKQEWLISILKKQLAKLKEKEH